MKSTNSVLGAWRIPIFTVTIFAALLLVVPFIVLVATSWTSGGFIQFPPTGFSLQWYESVLTDRRWTGPFWLSVGISLMSTVVAVIFGTAGALAVARLKKSTARIVRTLFIVPIALPPIAYAVGLYGVNRELDIFRGTLVTLVIGEALIAMPYVFVLVSGAMGRMDPALRSAATTLGAPWPLILRKVELPLLLPNIIAGAVFAFNVVFDEVVLSVFLLPVGTQTLPLKMLSSTQEAFSPQLSAASTMVSLLALVILGVFARYSSKGARTARKGARAARKVATS